MRRRVTLRGFVLMAVAGFFGLSTPLVLHAQQTTPDQGPTTSPRTSGDPDTDPPLIMFPHPETDRLWISGQANFISQWHPAFHSPYQGPNSFSPEAQDATSRVLTLFLGLQLSNSAAFLGEFQEPGGHGLSKALGLGGFTNLDVVRNPLLSKAPYVARLMWHQVIPLGREKTPSERTPLSLFKELPARRLEIR